jgi:tRNA dimethylallyltransferase
MGQIPIVVGGTSYWIQHLLFPNRLISFGKSMSNATESTCLSAELMSIVAQLPQDLIDLFNTLPEHPPSASLDAEAAFSLHSLLSALDPPIAARWHWRDTRKVLRSLSIIKETGRKASDMISAQAETDTQPRYDTLCFWLYAESAVLNPRLDARVDEMIEEGLLNEIRTLREISVATERGPFGNGDTPTQNTTFANYTLGIYQSIGSFTGI